MPLYYLATYLFVFPEISRNYSWIDPMSSQPENERISRMAKELLGYFKQFRETFYDPELPDGHPLNRLSKMSDKELDSAAHSMASLLVRYSKTRGSESAESELAQIALDFMNTPEALNILNSASDIAIFGTEKPSEALRDRDGALMFYRKAVKKFELGALAEAKSLLKKSIKLYDNYAPTWEALARVYEATGQADLARDASARASELRKNN